MVAVAKNPLVKQVAVRLKVVKLLPITEVTPELAPVTVVEETVQATNAPISGAKEEFDDEDLEDSDEFK